MIREATYTNTECERLEFNQDREWGDSESAVGLLSGIAGRAKGVEVINLQSKA